MVDPRLSIDQEPTETATVTYPHKWANILTAPLSEGAGESNNRLG